VNTSRCHAQCVETFLVRDFERPLGFVSNLVLTSELLGVSITYSWLWNLLHIVSQRIIDFLLKLFSN
jgi:hypothetical protein